MTKNDWFDQILDVIKRVSITDEDLEKKGEINKTVTMAHEKITNALIGSTEFDPWSKRYGIDFISRKRLAYGQMRLAVEVDTWWKPHGSWIKLADVRSENKVWVYITKDENAEKNFERGLKEIQRFLNSRNEKEETFGNFVAIMKTPTKFKKINVFDLLR